MEDQMSHNTRLKSRGLRSIQTWLPEAVVTQLRSYAFGKKAKDNTIRINLIIEQALLEFMEKHP